MWRSGLPVAAASAALAAWVACAGVATVSGVVGAYMPSSNALPAAGATPTAKSGIAAAPENEVEM